MTAAGQISKGRLIGEFVLVLFAFFIFSFIALIVVLFIQDGVNTEVLEIFNLPNAKELLAVPGFLAIPGGMLLTIGLVWGLQKIRGETLSDLGLKIPESWRRVVLLGVALAVFIFVAATGLTYFLAQFGMVPDSSDFNVILTDPMIFFYGMTAVAWLAAAFGEEVVFRGFLMRILYQLFGSNTVAAGFAITLQAAVFGMLHLNQGVAGAIVVFMIAAIFGLAFYRFGRSLWPLIIAHGLFDNIVFTLMYLGVDA